MLNLKEVIVDQIELLRQYSESMPMGIFSGFRKATIYDKLIENDMILNSHFDEFEQSLEYSLITQMNSIFTRSMNVGKTRIGKIEIAEYKKSLLKLLKSIKSGE